MSEITEIRWQGRGGQGAKTAALLFGELALETGKYIQAFPEYGPERMGAPMQAFNRLSDKPLSLHCQVATPDIVVILDPTLIGKIEVTAGLKEGGKIIVNTSNSPQKMREELKVSSSVQVFTVDAGAISKECLGKEIPNTPLMGALIKVGLLNLEEVLGTLKKELEKKFRTKPEVIEGNIKAVQRAYSEVKGE